MKTIAKYLSIVAVLALVIGSMLVVARRPAPINRQTDVALLRGEIQRLQSKVSALENRIGELQKSAAQNTATHPFILQVTNTLPPTAPFIHIPRYQPPISSDFADPAHPPKIWGEGECNGWKYYIIPLNGSPADISSTAQPIGLASLPNSGYNRR
ncbi:MAG TPA: hypothetical protein VN281_15675 [Verrucomicrobiae bacterium]|nr:hypothetical protein [Verrucomicrobiae bacterium]